MNVTSFNVMQMDRILVKVPATSSSSATGKARLHLPPNLAVKDRAGKYPVGTFHMNYSVWIDVLFVADYTGSCITFFKVGKNIIITVVGKY